MQFLFLIFLFSKSGLRRSRVRAGARSTKTKHRLNGPNGTQAGSLCYINAVASSLQVHGDSSQDGSGRSLDSPEGQCSKHRLPACVLFARCGCFLGAIGDGACKSLVPADELCGLGAAIRKRATHCALDDASSVRENLPAPEIRPSPPRSFMKKHFLTPGWTPIVNRPRALLLCGLFATIAMADAQTRTVTQQPYPTGVNTGYLVAGADRRL